MDKKVYLDNAATTFVSGEVLNEMMPCFNALYGNPSSIHSYGRDAAAIVDRARDRIKNAIGAKSVRYIYVFNDWFHRPEYKDMLEYIKSVPGCDYIFAKDCK